MASRDAPPILPDRYVASELISSQANRWVWKATDRVRGIPVAVKGAVGPPSGPDVAGVLLTESVGER